MKKTEKAIIITILLCTLVSCQKVEELDIIEDVNVNEPIIIEDVTIDKSVVVDVPKDEEIKEYPLGSNNGGKVIGYGKKTYLLLNEEMEGEEFANIYVFGDDIDINDRQRLISVPNTSINNMYIADDNIFYSFHDNSGRNIFKLPLDTEEGTIIGQGYINYVDAYEGVIYYSVILSDDNDGFYKMDFKGENIIKICEGGYTYIEKVDDIIYLERYTEEDDVVLASINVDGTDLKDIASIEPNVKEGRDSREYSNDRILDFYVTDDGFFLAIGEYQGSAGFLFGDTVKLSKDGQNIEYGYFSDTDEFNIIGDINYGMVYKNDIDTNVIIKEGLTTNAKEEYINSAYVKKVSPKDFTLFYGEHEEDIIHRQNLKSINVNTDKITNLFYGNSVTTYEHSYYVGYDNVEILDDYIYFQVDVYGYKESDGWRGHLCYRGYYRVAKDGSNLILIYENDNLSCGESSVEVNN